jgi:hypothetical protein
MRNKVQDHKHKCFIVSFTSFNLLIQDSYDGIRVEQDL